MNILGIETSCDETAAAVVRDGQWVLSNVISSQIALHQAHGGVVPELAARGHIRAIIPVVEIALAEAGIGRREVDTIAVTQGPGLAGSLLVGLNVAKTLAYVLDRPLVPVNHLEAHVYANWLTLPGQDPVPPPEFPLVCLLVSGGHTELILMTGHGRYRHLGRTLDDAAGEAFDKGARLLGLGYPGGAEIDRVARDGDPEAFELPVARVPGLDFSFSGLKTALLYTVRGLGEGEVATRRPDLAASYQSAIVRALVERIEAAVDVTGLERVALVGGVAANSALRGALPQARFAALALCTDNAAMIASAARFAEAIPPPGYLALDAYASIT